MNLREHDGDEKRQLAREEDAYIIVNYTHTRHIIYVYMSVCVYERKKERKKERKRKYKNIRGRETETVRMETKLCNAVTRPN